MLRRVGHGPCEAVAPRRRLHVVRERVGLLVELEPLLLVLAVVDARQQRHEQHLKHLQQPVDPCRARKTLVRRMCTEVIKPKARAPCARKKIDSNTQFRGRKN